MPVYWLTESAEHGYGVLSLAMEVSGDSGAAWVIVVLENSQMGHFCACLQPERA